MAGISAKCQREKPGMWNECSASCCFAQDYTGCPLTHAQQHNQTTTINMSDLNGVFKIVNLSVGGISAISGLTQLLSGVQSFFLGLYLILFGVGIVGLEFRIPPLTHQYASFLFSFLGRGIFYFLIGALVAHGNALRIILGLLIAAVGIAFTALEFIPSVEAPENFRTEGHVLADEDEDDII